MRTRIRAKLIIGRKKEEFEAALNKALDDGWYIHWKSFHSEGTSLYTILASMTIGGFDVSDKD